MMLSERILSPMQDPASFNLDTVKTQIQAMIKQYEGQ